MQFLFKVNSLYIFTISLFLLVNSTSLYSQTWQYVITPDFEFGIKDKWGELEHYEAKFVVANPRTAFVKEIEVNGDEWGKLLFPSEFIQTRGKFNPDSLTNFDWYIEVKNKIVAEGYITYDSSPNEVLQLNKYDPIGIRDKIDVWGNIQDAYSWIDKNGLNIFIRSKLNVEKGRYLYVYHFLEKEDNYIQVRKITDFVTNCDFEINAKHQLESIELTDINRDTIGEISFIYSVDCISDVSPATTKLILLNQGKKYAVRGVSKICINEESNQLMGGSYELGNELNAEPVIRRFMEKKWERFVNDNENQ